MDLTVSSNSLSIKALAYGGQYGVPEPREPDVDLLILMPQTTGRPALRLVLDEVEISRRCAGRYN